MSRVGRSFLLLLLGASAFLTAACGGDPPDKEMQQAQAAIDVAKAAGADRFAREELTGAEQALASAREAVDQRDYRLALNNALDSRERALDSREHAIAAARQAADAARKSRAEAERTMAEATAAVANARNKIQVAETAHVTGNTLAAARRAVVDCETAVQEARARLDAGDYKAVLDALPASTADLGRAVKDLEAAAPHLPRRRS